VAISRTGGRQRKAFLKARLNG